jgi:hypothetical protein
MWAIRMGFWRAPREGACAGRSRCADDGCRLMNVRSFHRLSSSCCWSADAAGAPRTSRRGTSAPASATRTIVVRSEVEQQRRQRVPHMMRDWFSPRVERKITPIDILLWFICVLVVSRIGYLIAGFYGVGVVIVFYFTGFAFWYPRFRDQSTKGN